MRKYLLSLVIFVFCIFLVTGCNNSKKSTIKKVKADIKEVQKNKKETKTKKEIKNKKAKKDTIVGSYEIIELKDDDETYDKKTIDSLDIDYSFEVKKDKTAIMRLSDEVEKLTYDDKYFKNDKEKVEYKYNKGKLVLTKNDTVLIFQKK